MPDRRALLGLFAPPMTYEEDWQEVVRRMEEIVEEGNRAIREWLREKARKVRKEVRWTTYHSIGERDEQA